MLLQLGAQLWALLQQLIRHRQQLIQIHRPVMIAAVTSAVALTSVSVATVFAAAAAMVAVTRRPALAPAFPFLSRATATAGAPTRVLPLCRGGRRGALCGEQKVCVRVWANLGDWLCMVGSYRRLRRR